MAWKAASFEIFTSVALFLAIIGLYGLLNQEVQLSTRQIGIRMALGSTRRILVAQVLRRAAVLLTAGVGAGWVLTLAIRRIAASVVIIHPGHDVALVLILSAGFVAIGMLCAAIPARRAASVDPMQPLRTELT